MVRWREAMDAALYGPDGFFVRPDNEPAAHFRTAALASPLLARALLRLLARIDTALDHPEVLELVDIGAGRGELLSTMVDHAPPELAPRLRPLAVELAPAPADPGMLSWQATLPDTVTGLLLATEWLDNVPVEVAETDPDGVARYVLVDPADGTEKLGEPVAGADAAWLERWWSLPGPGARAEIGRPRDEAWAGAVAAMRRGAALAIDYGHVAATRPPFGTLTAFRYGRQVAPVPDGSRDLTAHVAIDAVADAGAEVAGGGDATAMLTTQAEALRALGVHGTRPARELALRDPPAYLRELSTAGEAAELTDPAGLGGHHWLLQPVALPPADWLRG